MSALLRRVRRRAAATWLAQSAAVAACAAALTAAALELDGALVREPAALAVIASCGLLAGATWWREQREPPRELARSADRRLGLDGALLTAFEAEQRGAPPFARLLAERMLRALGRFDARRAAPLPSLGWLAAPLFGVGVWLAAAELRALAAPEAARLAREVRGALAGAPSSVAGDAAAARGLAAQLERAAAAARLDEAGAARDARRLDSALEHLVESGELPETLELELAAARERLAELASRWEDASPVAGAFQGGLARGAGGSPLQSGPGQSTMTGSTDDGRPLRPHPDERPASRTDSTSPAAPDQLGAPGPEAGVVTGRWWSAEHDGVVAAWRALER